MMSSRFRSFAVASVIVLAGAAIALDEILGTTGRPFLLGAAILLIGAAGFWLFDEFRQKRKRR
jgi:hypothetical protein